MRYISSSDLFRLNAAIFAGVKDSLVGPKSGKDSLSA